MRIADYIAEELAKTGTDSLFMLSGGMIMHLMDAFGRRPEFKYYCNFHEQACAMAADAYARQTGKLGLCLATSGPGATNLLTGLVGAYQDSIPIFFITGQCKLVETIQAGGIPGLRQNGFLEADIVPIVQSVTKYAAFVESPERVRYHLEKALYLARKGRPGPVLLDIPLDIQGAPMPENGGQPYIPEQDVTILPEPHEIDSILDALEKAQRPLILAGHGVRCAQLVDSFRTLLQFLQVPVATTQMAKDLLPQDHPLFVGHPGPRSQRGANFAVQSADLILIIGCSLNVQTTGYEGDLFASDARKIQIDIDPSLLMREKIGVETKYCWDLTSYLPMLIARAEARGIAAPEVWRSACRGWKQSYPIHKEPHDWGETDGPINLYEFAHELSQALSGEETILVDAGQPHPIMAQAFQLKGSQRYLNPGSFAEMGYALPASFGVAAGDPQRTVVVIIGDGSLQTNIQELQTLVHYNFNVKLFIINNGGYASIRNTQNTFFKGFYVGSTPESGVTLPSIEKIMAAYGLPFVRCDSRSVLAERIREVLEKPGPVVCEVMAQYTQRILPAVPSYLLADGRMRSKALHEMAPDIGKTLDEVIEEASLPVVAASIKN